MWDPRQRDVPVASMEPEAMGTKAVSAVGTSLEGHRDCWCVAFGDAYDLEHRCVVGGFDNGDLKLFDLRTMSVRWETNLKNGVRLLCRIFSSGVILMS